MRMRRKKHLHSRLAACEEYFISVPVSKISSAERPEKMPLELSDIFGRSGRVFLDVGCGKGQFVCEMARRFPEADFIAVELNTSVIVQAAEKAKSAGLKNVRFLRLGAELLDVYLPDNSIDGIYLNFSTPFPKKRQAKHRLTHRSFLEIYRRILKSGGKIEQKTDNMTLFEFSVCELSHCGYKIDGVWLDWRSEGGEGSVVTEYEARFVGQGMPIYRLEAHVEGD